MADACLAHESGSDTSNCHCCHSARRDLFVRSHSRNLTWDDYGHRESHHQNARIEAMWQRHGQRLAERLLSERELPEFQAHAHPARFLVKRFAAKEAFAKTVGSGLRHPVSLSRISISHDGLGKPVLQFDATLRTYLAQLGVSAHHLSISDERSTIVAFVVLETI